MTERTDRQILPLLELLKEPKSLARVNNNVCLDIVAFSPLSAEEGMTQSHHCEDKMME